MSPTTEAMAARLVQDGATPDSAHLLAGIVLDRLIYDAAGKATVLDAAGRPQVDELGQPVSVVAMMDGLRRNLPQFFTTPAKTSSTSSAQPAAETQTAKVLREAHERLARAEASKAAAEPNPWAKGSENVTRQIMLASRDPQRATRLRAEAGVR